MPEMNGTSSRVAPEGSGRDRLIVVGTRELRITGAARQDHGVRAAKRRARPTAPHLQHLHAVGQRRHRVVEGALDEDLGGPAVVAEVPDGNVAVVHDFDVAADAAPCAFDQRPSADESARVAEAP